MIEKENGMVMWQHEVLTYGQPTCPTLFLVTSEEITHTYTRTLVCTL